MMIRKYGIIAAVLAAATLPLLGAVSASAAAAPQLSVTLAAGTSSTAVFDSNGNVILTAGTDAGTAAYVDVNGESGQQAPASAPTFTSSPAQSAGDPRWVVEFHNGCYLFGDGTADHWAVNPGGAQDVSYATALADAKACGQDNWVTAAFIVADAGNHGIAYHLTNIQYNGQSANAVVSNNVLVRNRHSGKCLNEDQAHGGAASQFTCSNIYASLQWRTERFADGTTYLQSVQTGGLLKSGASGAQLTLTGTPAGNTTAFLNGGIFRFPSGLVMDDAANSTANFAKVIGFAFNGQNNQRWDFTAIPA